MKFLVNLRSRDNSFLSNQEKKKLNINRSENKDKHCHGHWNSDDSGLVREESHLAASLHKLG